MELKEKIRGAIAGFAYGDALGLGTEFMTRSEVQTYYPGGLRKFSQIIRDPHRSQWSRGSWNNDTDILLFTIESFLEEKKFDLNAQARKYKQWFKTQCIDPPGMLGMVVECPGWEEHPITTAHKVWHGNHIIEASNEALPRGIAAALICDEQGLMELVRQLILMTHDDSLCVATAMILARMTYDLLHNEKMTPYEELQEIVTAKDPRVMPFLEKAYNGDIDGLKIDDQYIMSWTRISMACGLWSLWHSDNASEMIYKVIDRGGDADCNAAISGAFAGIKYGFSALPDGINELKGLSKLLEIADRLTEYIENENKNKIMD